MDNWREGAASTFSPRTIQSPQGWALPSSQLSPKMRSPLRLDTQLPGAPQTQTSPGLKQRATTSPYGQQQALFDSTASPRAKAYAEQPLAAAKGNTFPSVQQNVIVPRTTSPSYQPSARAAVPVSFVNQLSQGPDGTPSPGYQRSPASSSSTLAGYQKATGSPRSTSPVPQHSTAAQQNVLPRLQQSPVSSNSMLPGTPKSTGSARSMSPIPQRSTSPQQNVLSGIQKPVASPRNPLQGKVPLSVASPGLLESPVHQTNKFTSEHHPTTPQGSMTPQTHQAAEHQTAINSNRQAVGFGQTMTPAWSAVPFTASTNTQQRPAVPLSIPQPITISPQPSSGIPQRIDPPRPPITNTFQASPGQSQQRSALASNRNPETFQYYGSDQRLSGQQQPARSASPQRSGLPSNKTPDAFQYHGSDQRLPGQQQPTRPMSPQRSGLPSNKTPDAFQYYGSDQRLSDQQQPTRPMSPQRSGLPSNKTPDAFQYHGSDQRLPGQQQPTRSASPQRSGFPSNKTPDAFQYHGSDQRLSDQQQPTRPMSPQRSGLPSNKTPDTFQYYGSDQRLSGQQQPTRSASPQRSGFPSNKTPDAFQYDGSDQRHPGQQQPTRPMSPQRSGLPSNKTLDAFQYHGSDQRLSGQQQPTRSMSPQRSAYTKNDAANKSQSYGIDAKQSMASQKSDGFEPVLRKTSPNSMSAVPHKGPSSREQQPGSRIHCYICYEDITGSQHALPMEGPTCISCFDERYSDRCETCNQVINVESTEAYHKGRHWHKQCFKCDNCNTSLSGASYVGKGNEVFCRTCYDAKFNRCAVCNIPFKIGTSALKFNDKLYHDACCRCKGACNKPLADKEFIERRPNELLCMECFSKERCVECNEGVKGTGYICCNKLYHKACFKCTKCLVKLSNGKFNIKNDKPYCNGCYEMLLPLNCTACSKPINGAASPAEYVTFEKQNWHKSCYNCSMCARSLYGKNIAVASGTLRCSECARYSNSKQR